MIANLLFFYLHNMLQQWWALLRGIFVVLFGLMLNTAYAQEKPLELAYLDRASSRPTRSSNAEEPKEELPKIDTRIILDAPLSLNSFQNLRCPRIDYWTEYANQPSHHIVYEYSGLQKVIYNQLDKVASRYYNQQLRIFWNESHLHPMDLDRAMRNYALSSANQYQWWNRPWYDSLPEEKGGERTIVQRVGERTNVFRWRSFSLNNEGKFSWDIWRVDVEDNPEANLSDLEALQRGEVLNKYNLGVLAPEAHHRDRWYDISWSVRANIRVDKFTLENRSQIGFTCKVHLLTNDGTPYLRAQVVAQLQPFTGAATVRFQVALLEF